MPPVMVGLLAAVGAAMSALVAFVQGDLVWITIADAAVATGLAAYLSLSPKKASMFLITYKAIFGLDLSVGS